MFKKDLKELDYLILACLVNSDETAQDIVDMVQHFIALRMNSQAFLSSNIQNPPSETKKEV